MSKYTTQVRFICETSANLTESAGFNDIEDILDNSWNKIFSDFPIFDEEYRSELCKKILRHYYTREICCETVGRWKLFLSDKMKNIMPYYNQLYKSALLTIEPLINTKNETSHHETADETNSQQNTSTDSATENETNNQTITDTKSSNSKDNSTNSGTTNSTNDNWVLSSDTPQGGLKGIKDMEYLTNATNNNGTSTINVNGTDTSTNESSENGKNVLEGKRSKTDSKQSNFNSSMTKNNAIQYLTNNKGISGVSESELLLKFRETFLNIDMMIIDELKDLFFTLW